MLEKKILLHLVVWCDSVRFIFNLKFINILVHTTCCLMCIHKPCCFGVYPHALLFGVFNTYLVVLVCIHTPCCLVCFVHTLVFDVFYICLVASVIIYLFIGLCSYLESFFCRTPENLSVHQIVSISINLFRHML